MAIPRCPTCQTPHPFESAQPGTMLLCESCGEVFEAPGSALEAEPLRLDPELKPVSVPGPETKTRSGGEEPRPAPSLNPERTESNGFARVLLAAGAAALLA